MQGEVTDIKAVGAWLEELGLPQYADLFEQNGIDFDVLSELTAEHLKEMGITVLGHRLKIIKALGAFKVQATPTAPSQPLNAVSTLERRNLTIMFCDLVGSTALSARLDPEDYRDVMTLYQETVSHVVREAGGHVAKYLGDGVLIYFGYPIAQEDAVERACRAGFETIAAIAQLKTISPDPLEIRIGVATGVVVVGDLYGAGFEEAGAVSGETPNLAARLQGLAKPGGMVISDATRVLLGDMFEYEELTGLDIKGFDPGQTAWRVLAEAQGRERFSAKTGQRRITPMVGRASERDALFQAWETVRAGQGQVVLLSGEAGIGKSRLTYEIVEQVRADGADIITYQTAPYFQNTAFYPIRRNLERALGFKPDDSEDARLAKLETLVSSDSAPEESASLMSALLAIFSDRYPPLNLSPTLQKSRTIDLLVQRILARSATGPVLVQFEDLHWIDPTSLEFLTQFISQLSDHPVLLLATFRPEFSHDWAGDHISSVSLERLTSDDVDRLFDQLTGGRSIPPEQRRQMLDRSDGVPLFAEELARFVLDGQAQAANGDIPFSLQDSLMARLDKLGNTKELAQIGAVMGREIDMDLLARVADMKPEDLARNLEQLAEADLVMRAPESNAWIFRHALLQEAAYRSMLRRRRQKLHKSIAETLEKEFPERCKTGPEQVANHLLSAGLGARSVPYWLTAGKSAWARASLKEALAHLDHGLGAVGEIRNRSERAKLELQLQSTIGVVHFAATSYASPQAAAAFERARDLLEDVDDPDLGVAVLYGIGAYQTMRGDVRAGHETFERLATEVARSGNKRYEIYSASMQTWSLYNRGDYAGSARRGERVLELYAEGHWDAPGPRLSAAEPKVISECFRAAALWSLGYPEQGGRVADETIAYARTLTDPYSLVYALANGAIRLLGWNGEWDRVMELTAECSKVASEYGYGFLGLWGSFWRARAMVEFGEIEEAERMMAGAVKACKNAGVLYHRVSFESYHARMLIGLNRIEEASAVLEPLDRALADGGELSLAVDLNLVRAELAQAEGDPAAARGLYEKALAMSVDQKALSWELRSALGLAPLLPDAESRRALIAPIVARFSEGAGTGDLVAARAYI